MYTLIFMKNIFCEPFDYVDTIIKMFSNMFNTRLKGYRKLHYSLIDGFEFNQNKLLSKQEYFDKLLKDIEYCFLCYIVNPCCLPILSTAI